MNSNLTTNSLTSFMLLASGAHMPIQNRMALSRRLDDMSVEHTTTTSTRPPILPAAAPVHSASLLYNNASNYLLMSSSSNDGNNELQLHDDEQTSANNHVEMVMHLITLLSSSTSLVMLCFSIITYSLFSDMRDLAGLVMLNASVALFFCQLLLLVGIDRVVEHQLPLCNAIATLMHLFWLATLFWFVIGIYDLAQDFRTRLAPSAPGNTLRDTLIAYCLAGWGIPVGIVCLCTLLENTHGGSGSVVHSTAASFGTRAHTTNQTTTTTVAFHYLHHFRTRCWFPDTHGVIFGLLVPFCLALPVVILCMRQTWYNIELTSRLSAKAGVVKRWKKPDAIMFELYIKLFCVSGVIWLVCFIAGVGLFPDGNVRVVGSSRRYYSTNNQHSDSNNMVQTVHSILWYAFEISLAMFGTCVSLLFTCNGAVFKAYASGRSKRSRRHSSIISTGGGGASVTSGTGTYSYTTATTSGITGGAAANISLATIHESWSGERLMEADALAISDDQHDEQSGVGEKEPMASYATEIV